MKRMNLLPKEMRPRPDRFHLGQIKQFVQVARRSPLIRLSTVLAACLALLIVWQGTAIWRYQFDTGRLKKELKQLQALNAQLGTQQQALNAHGADLLVERERLEKRRQDLIDAKQTAAPLSAVLAELVGVLPAEIWINKLTFGGEELKLVGSSRETQSVADLMASLDSSGQFRETQFAYTQRSEQAADSAFTFEISTKPVF